MALEIRERKHKALRQSLARAVLVLAVCVAFPATHASGKERLQRRFDQRDGLPVSEVTQLVQDTDDFLWIGTRGGLVRFDGHEMRTWAPKVLAGEIVGLTAGTNREVIAGLERGEAVLGRWKQMALYRITEHGAEPLVGPEGSALVSATSARFVPDGSLWITRGTDLLKRQPDGAWRVLRIPTGEQVFHIEPSGDHDVLVIAESGLWHVGADGTARRLVAYPRILVALAVPDGSVYFVEDGMIIPGRLMMLHGGRMQQVLQLPARPLSMARRNETLWVAFDRYLVALRPGESPEIIGPNDGLPSGGPMLVDKEASLWLGTFQGLIQFPEPDTVVWNHRDGLPSQHTTFMARLSNPSEGFWAATWQGLGRMRHSVRGWRAESEDFMYAGNLCPDSQGRLWLAMGGEFLEHSLARSVAHPVPGLHWPGFCTAAPDGTVWILTPSGLYRSALASRAPQLVTSRIPNILQNDPGAILHGSHDQIWVSEADTICHANATELMHNQAAAWVCQPLPGAGTVFGLIELPNGDLWAATEQNGVWRYKDARWWQFAGSTHAPYQKYGNLRPSLQSGVWLLSEGGVARVIGREDNPAEWQVLERLSSWQGVPTVSSIDLLEDPDGSLWISSVAGVIHVPFEARSAPMPVPRVRLVAVTADRGEVVPSPGLQIPYGRFLELRFAALSFRDRSRLHYQMRMHADAPWQDVSEEPVFRYLHLKARPYEVEVRASLDGEHWSADPAHFAFEVLPPWYGQGWALLTFALLLTASLYGVYRARLAMLLRLERQRARIAMDLHDEMGSALGSIRLLAGLAAEKSLPESERIATANEIAEAAGEIGTALGEIVWSLRPGSGRLDALAAHLIERGARLFPDEKTVFRSEIPESLPPVELSLGVRRAVALIAIEAMHNASRHAGANHVIIGLVLEGRQWKLWVSDDGRGLRHDGLSEHGGMGLHNMKQRAQEIGAQLSFSANGNSGTTVTVLFTPQG